MGNKLCAECATSDLENTTFSPFSIGKNNGNYAKK